MVKNKKQKKEGRHVTLYSINLIMQIQTIIGILISVMQQYNSFP